MPGIKLTSRDSFDDAYRKFKRQCDRNLIVTEARARQNFETQTEKNKKEKIATRKKILKNSSCLEDTSLDCNQSLAEHLLCHSNYATTFYLKSFSSLYQNQTQFLAFCSL